MITDKTKLSKEQQKQLIHLYHKALFQIEAEGLQIEACALLAPLINKLPLEDGGTATQDATDSPKANNQ